MSTSVAEQPMLKVSTSFILWHGGGDNGKPDPVYSVDMHPNEAIMATSGIDDSIPPKGSVRVSFTKIIIRRQHFYIFWLCIVMENI